jgi:hypothetical protein
MRYKPKKERTMDRNVGIARCECGWGEQKNGTASIPTCNLLPRNKLMGASHADGMISRQDKLLETPEM